MFLSRKHYIFADLICVIFFHKCTFGFNFSPHENCINFAYRATFSTSHTCHMWKISDFSTSVIRRHLRFHMWRNFQFPHSCHTFEISPRDNCFSTNIIRDIREKYQVWFPPSFISSSVTCLVLRTFQITGSGVASLLKSFLGPRQDKRNIYFWS